MINTIYIWLIKHFLLVVIKSEDENGSNVLTCATNFGEKYNRIAKQYTKKKGLTGIIFIVLANEIIKLIWISNLKLQLISSDSVSH